MREDEFLSLIRSISSRDLTNDGAFVCDMSGHNMVITTDSMVEGRHFLENSGGFHIAQRLLRANLSDIAAMGAEPAGYTLNACWKKGIEDAWVRDFVKGLRVDQSKFEVEIWGGDTVVSDLELSFSITFWGKIRRGEKPIARSTARPGDLIFVSGELGRAASNLRKCKFWNPEPRISLGLGLQCLATSACDISDGLYLDSGKIASSSNVGMEIESSRVPVFQDATLEEAMCGGDDYELLFTVGQGSERNVEDLSRKISLPVTRIGQVTRGQGVSVLGIDLSKFKHLAANQWTW